MNKTEDIARILEELLSILNLGFDVVNMLLQRLNGLLL